MNEVVSRQWSAVSCRSRFDRQQRFHCAPRLSFIHGPSIGRQGTTDGGLRTGLSLTETLIAMGILTLGLLGVASLFPVGSYYMQNAEINDRGAAVAKSAMNDLVASGMLDPQKWRMYRNVPATTAPAGANPPTWAATSPLDADQHTYTRQFATALANGVAWTATNSVVDRQKNLAKLFGHAYVIDPLAIAVTSFSSNSNNRIASIFPASFSEYYVTTGSPFSAQWAPWASGGKNEGVWPIRRITFAEPSTVNPYAVMSPSMAGRYFRCLDDLTSDLPTRDDRAASQNWDSYVDTADSNKSKPLARQWTGDYSWIATVVPKSSTARDAMATSPGSYSYDVSVVVFYKRLLNNNAPASPADLTSAYPAVMQNERYVYAKILSSGLNGGEVLLTRNQTEAITESPFKNLKVGQWIMLCGPHPNSTDIEPRFELKWYQVQSITGNGQRLDASGNPSTNSSEPERRIVALRGPQWPWQPASSLTDNSLSNSLCAGIIRGAVAVHTKSIRLEGKSAWSMK